MLVMAPRMEPPRVPHVAPRPIPSFLIAAPARSKAAACQDVTGSTKSFLPSIQQLAAQSRVGYFRTPRRCNASAESGWLGNNSKQ